MINVNKFGSMAVQPGHRKFTIPWGENSKEQECSLKDRADASQVVKTTQDIVSSHNVATIPSYQRAFYRRPMWSEDLDPSRTNDVRTLEMNGNTYRSHLVNEPAPKQSGLPQGYHKKSFHLADDNNTIEVKASYTDGKLVSASHSRTLKDGTSESISFQINSNGTLTYESFSGQQ